MKKIFIFLNFIAAGLLLFNACDPVKDYRNQYNLLNDPLKVKFADTVKVYTLISSDYLKSSVSGISTNKNFSATYPANPNLLEILNKGYNAPKGSQLIINYNYYNPLVLKDSVSYALVNGDYGNKYNNYSVITDVYGYLAKSYPSATRGKVVILTYNWRASTTTSVTNSFVYLGDAGWMIVSPVIALADYNAMGQTYANFSSTADANYYIPLFLKNKYPYAKSGDQFLVQYALYVSSKTTQNLMLVTYNGTAWNIVGSIVTANTLVNFDGTAWSFPPKVVQATDAEVAATTPILYTLTHADYVLIGESYDDFDRRATGKEASTDVVISDIGKILLARFSNLSVGQVYTVTYNNYTGTNPAPAATISVKVVPNN